MLKNYLKITLRNLIKNKSQTAINIGGLTLGIVCAILIFLVIQFDLSFDRWHPDSDQLYRVVTRSTDFGQTEYSRGGPYPLAETIENDISGVSNVTMIFTNYSNVPIISYQQEGNYLNKFKDDGVAFVEQDYFDMFATQWIDGDKNSALQNPNTAVLTKSFAEKLFGRVDPIGKIVSLNAGAYIELEVTGIIQDPPNNTDFPFTMIGALHSKTVDGEEFGTRDSWSSSSSSIQTYVKLEAGVTEEQINAELEELIIKYRNEEVAEYLDFYLQPLADIHFNSTFDNYNNRTVEKPLLFTLGIIGAFLLLTACINFINLNTALAVSRSKEVGLRKTLGGTRFQLTLHFLGETAFVTLIALFLSIGISEIALQYIEPLLGFTPDLNLLGNPQILFFLMGLVLVITVLAGWYPARYLSGFNPIQAIRNKISSSYGKGLTLRRGLIVVQFTITQILIIGTIIISSQIKFFQSQDLGYDIDAIVEVRIPDNESQKTDTFKNLLLNESSILKVTYSNTGSTSSSTWSGNYLVTDDTVQYENNAQLKYIDPDFVETYGLTILAGQDLIETDSTSNYLINEELARQIGYGENYEGTIGLPNLFWGHEAPIVGVVKDFNTQSLHTELSPVILLVSNSNVFYRSGIRINANQTTEAIAAIEQTFDDVFPEAVFEYTFLDEDIAQMYEDEQRTQNIMNAFTIIAIIIGSLGLFGLVSYMATTRTKEIGVRKVLGATIPDILRIFASELGLLTGISFLIAAPVSYYFMKQWLQDFAYRIDIGVEIFAGALLGTIVIAALTVGYKSISAALANPIDSLKTE